MRTNPLRVSRTDIARLLQQATKVVNSRNTIPILDTVRLVAADGRLTVTATDLDIEVSGGIEAEGDFAGCLNARMLAGIVGKLPGDTVEIEAEGPQVTVKAGRSRFKLAVLPIDDFPTMEAGAFATSAKLDLAALLAPVAFAMSSEETRYYLNGVHLHEYGGALVAVATDGHRLGCHTGPAAPDNFPAIIVPRDTVSIVPKGEVTLEASDTKIRIMCGDGTTIISKLVQGTFPDYRRVIPTGNDKLVTFTAADMIAAAERVSAIAAERGGAGVRLAIADGEIALTLRGAGNEATDAVACQYDGEPIEIGFSPTYVAELLSKFPAGTVSMALADAGSPAVFTSDANDALLCVLMPRRV